MKTENDLSSTSSKSNKFQVVYACSAVSNCKWAICVSCYDKLHETRSGKYSPRNPLAQSATDAPISLLNLPYRSAKSRAFTYDALATDGLEEGEDSDELSEAVIASLTDAQVITSTTEETVTCWSVARNGVMYVLKSSMMIAAIDWFYIKFTFVFAHKIFDTLLVHLTSTDGMLSESQDGTKKKPNLPWFYAVRNKANDLKNEKVVIDEKWSEIAASFPSYYRMVITVQDDLCPKPVHKSVMCNGCGVSKIVGNRYYSPVNADYNLCDTCEHASTKSSVKTRLYRSKHGLWYHFKMLVAICASWTIVGQLCSERGVLIWKRVMHNYYIFVLVSAGIWTEDVVRDFEIEHHFERQEFETEKINQVVVKAVPSSSQNVGIEFNRDTNDSDDRLQLISALVSTRVVLIQLIPYMTIYSTLAVDISSSPICIYSAFLQDKVSELFATELRSKAVEELKLMGAMEADWKIALLQYYIFWQNSRAMCFLQNIVSNFVALSLVFANGAVLRGVLNFSLIWFVFQALILTINPLILLHKLMFNEAKMLMKRDMANAERDIITPPVDVTSIYPEIELATIPSMRNVANETEYVAVQNRGECECTETDFTPERENKLTDWFEMPTEI